MRLTVLWLTACVMAAAPAFGGQPPRAGGTSTAELKTSSRQDAPFDLPVSLDKIKGALSEAPVEPLRGLADEAHFKVEIREKQTISLTDLIDAMDFKSGPAVPGGLYGFEQNRLAFPSVDNPIRQPYAAFSQPELLTVLIENLAVKYLGGRALDAVSGEERARAERAAREEVQRALADYSAARQHNSSPKR